MPIPSSINEPLPFWDALVNKVGQITDVWTRYFEQTLVPQVRSATMIVGQYSNGATPLTDALPITILAESVPATGIYLFLAAIQIVAAAGVSSDVTLNLTWTSNGVVQSESFGPVTNGTDTDHLSAVFSLLCDGGTPVSMTTTYNSNPVNDLQYNLAASLNINGLPSLES